MVMFPFMAQGHIIPFLALAIEIEQKRGCTITFVNTPLNIKRIKTCLSPNSSIHLLEIPFQSSDHGLPPDCENTNDLPYHLILKLVEASRFQRLRQFTLCRCPRTLKPVLLPPGIGSRAGNEAAITTAKSSKPKNGCLKDLKIESRAISASMGTPDGDFLLEEEIGVCVEVAGGRTSEVKNEDMVAKINLVMNETENGKEMRKKACEIR
ncbi:unnamed protein product [Dovyalis caffra]|uniref:Uncharacterized protein n=1 Tax=Dovyalis caffra TaxID=77055 RepID=A0AAV1RUZ5_9ROSI|nr:unnamed protein product [Dovyalis caffra]